MSEYGHFLIGPKDPSKNLERELEKYSTLELLEEVKKYRTFKETSEISFTLQNPRSLCYIHAKSWPKETKEIFEVYNAITRVLAERLLEQQSSNS
jgi:hypothetical protein